MDENRVRFIRNFIIELIVYGLLVLGYFLLVLQTIGDWLTSLYDNNLQLYAVLSLTLIVKGVFLDTVIPQVVDRASCSVLVVR